MMDDDDNAPAKKPALASFIFLERQNFIRPPTEKERNCGSTASPDFKTSVPRLCALDGRL
jgi:hypothetical protein